MTLGFIFPDVAPTLFPKGQIAKMSICLSPHDSIKFNSSAVLFPLDTIPINRKAGLWAINWLIEISLRAGLPSSKLPFPAGFLASSLSVKHLRKPALLLPVTSF